MTPTDLTALKEEIANNYCTVSREHDNALREVRDAVFGSPSTDCNWSGCQDSWMKPQSAAWLVEKFDGTKLQLRSRV